MGQEKVAGIQGVVLSEMFKNTQQVSGRGESLPFVSSITS
jgi:hypothetical protein